MHFTLCTSSAFAVRPYTPIHPDPVLEPWRWRSFPELNGLGLRCMAEAKDKAMWFGVDDGVRRYDGVKWTAYTEKDGVYGGTVNTLCATQDGSLYAGTEMGISRFQNGKWSRVFPPEGDLPWFIPPTPSYTYQKLMEARDGSVWAGTIWGALRLSQEGSILYTTKAMGIALRAIAPYVRLSIVPEEAAPARLYGEGIGISTAGGGRISEVIWALAPGGPGEAAGLKVGDRITARNPVGASVKLTVQREGHAQPFEVTVTQGQVVGTYRDFRIFEVYEGRDGAIWFGLHQGEIVCYDIRNKQAGDTGIWRLYSEKDGLDIGNRPYILQARDGTLWVVNGNPNKGVNRFDGKRWTHFRLSHLGGSDHNASIMETRDGTVWVSGHRGFLHAYRKGSWTIYQTTSDVPIPTVYNFLLEASDGALWIAGRGQEAARLDYEAVRWTTYQGLWFWCETPDGAQWFTLQDEGVMRHEGQTWTRYGVEDGLMDSPGGLIVTREGVLWAAGSHDSTAATARFDGRRWSLQTHPRISNGINGRTLYESSDGNLWLGVFPGGRRDQAGVLRFDGKAWVHYTPPEVPRYPYGIGQTADGVLYVGGITPGMVRFDGKIWTRLTEPEEVTVVNDVVYATPKGDLWVGTRQYGAFHYDGKVWKRYDVRDGLADNGINGILQTEDGSVWVGTAKGISRFDGRTWTTHALPPDWSVETYWGLLRQSRDGAIWINSYSRTRTSIRVWSIRYQSDAVPPETEITLSLDKVSQPGNTTIAWRGADPWKATPDEEIQYSYRMDGGEWSPFSAEKNKVFLALSSGAHTFEVRARDRDFNVDPTPAAIRFTVVPPVWRQPWFIGLMAVLLGAIAFQTARVVWRDRRLREANTALSSGNKELFALNRDLQQTLKEKEEAQRQLIQAERMAAVGELVAGSAHELNNPMAVASSMMQSIGEVLKEDTPEELVQDRALMLQNVQVGLKDLNRAKDIVSSLLSLSDRTRTYAEAVQVNIVADDALRVLKGKYDEEKIRVVREYDEDLPTVTGSFADLGQMAMHLVRNAVEAIKGSGTITLRTAAEDGQVVFECRDTGMGIPSEIRGDIFKPFFKTKPPAEGTGLGLYICHQIVEKHGGTIEVESAVGKGSTFRVKLPVRR